ncbi:uncharacterized protein LOC143470192 [Clavelina lepadiformis]|uniref:Uncharacterized protein n=1 Tax=Clavelina lepadiformis TaxID=159417 RepID=A0ABP0FW57_CLALP
MSSGDLSTESNLNKASGSSLEGTSAFISREPLIEGPTSSSNIPQDASASKTHPPKKFKYSKQTNAKQILDERAENALETLRQVLEEQSNLINELTANIEHTKNSLSSNNEDTSLNHEAKIVELEEEIAPLKEQIQTYSRETKEKDKQLMDLAEKYENILAKYISEKEEADRLRSIGSSVNSTTASLSSVSTLQTSFLSEAGQEPVSLPSNLTSSESNRYIEKIKQLENQVKAHETTNSKLKDMNIQWQLYDKQREKIIQNLKEKLDSKTRELSQLQRRNDPSSSLGFTPDQQEHVDSFYQRLRREADSHKSERDIARRALAEMSKKLDDAKKNVAEQCTKIAQLESEKLMQSAQTEELQAALIVATRSQFSQSSPVESETITSLREAARQYEVDLRNTSAENTRLHEEIQRLERQLRQNPPGVVQTIINP